MRYTYRHPRLRPLALSVHVWFLGNSIVVTLFGVFVLRELGLEPWVLGIVLMFGGVGGVVGALLAPRIGARLGAGRAILLGRALVVLPWVTLAVTPLGSAENRVLAITIVSAAQLVYGCAMGIEDANDIGYRQAVTPDAIQGRMNATIRSTNRLVFFVGAILAGIVASFWGYHVALGLGAAMFAIAAAIVALSPLRRARYTG